MFRGILWLVVLTSLWSSGARADDGDWLLPVSCIGFGLGSAGLVSAAVTGGLALAKSAELETACGPDGGCPPERAGEIESMRALAHASTASWVIAGVGLAAGIGTLVALELGDDDAGAAVVLGPAAAGLTIDF